MIPVLAGVVEHGRQIGLVAGKLDQLLERLTLQSLVLLDQSIKRRHVCLMVLAVVELEGLLTHAAGSEGVNGERQRGE